MKVFLLSDDLFLEPPVQLAIMAIFGSLTIGDTPMNLSTFSGAKFSGFLEDFISQFSAVSYGNEAFASVLFLFLRMELPVVSTTTELSIFYYFTIFFCI